MTIERKIKNEYSLIFDPPSKYWLPFKQMSDYYFSEASHLKKRDIKYANRDLRLWIRNIQKRLYLGIGIELLLKSIYLKNGYNINKPKKGKELKFPEKFQNIDNSILNPADTYTLNNLISKLDIIVDLENCDKKKLTKGLNICKVFRNKEGHIAVYKHEFDTNDYSDIEYSIIELYRIGFDQTIEFNVSMEKNEKGEFII